MDNNQVCPICGLANVEYRRKEGGSLNYIYHCNRCGDFSAPIQFVVGHQGNIEKNDHWRLSGLIRLHNQNTDTELAIEDHEHYKKLIKDSLIPDDDDIDSKIYFLTSAIKKRSSSLGQRVPLILDIDYPLAFAKNPTELDYLVKECQKRQLIDIVSKLSGGYYYLILTPEGNKHLIKIDKPSIGAKELDIKLVHNNMTWLKDHPNSQLKYSRALEFLSEKKYEDAITNSFSALEGIVKEFMNKDGVLDNEKMIGELIVKLGLDKHWGQIVNHYCKYAHDFSSRHGKKDQNFPKPDSDIVEFFIYVTGSLIFLISKRFEI